MRKDYSEEFIKAIHDNPTVYHWCTYTSNFLTSKGFEYLPERVTWDDKIKRGGSYFTTRNGSSIVAFKIGTNWQLGENGVGVIGCHIDALTTKLKPFSKKDFKQGYRQLGVAPYSGAMSSVWWDRDLSIGGRVIIKSPDGKFSIKLAHIEHPIARIPTLAEHFGSAADGPFNQETQMTPIIGQEGDNEIDVSDEEKKSPLYGRHDIKLLRAIADNVGVKVADIYQLELELFDSQPGTLGGLDKEFLFCPRLDDKLCSFAAIQSLIETSTPTDSISCVALFDNEEIGSLSRQGAKGGLFQHTFQRVFEQLGSEVDDDYIRQTYANSFFISSDVTHAVNPNFSDIYLEHHKPKLNTGLVVKIDPNGHTTSDGISTAFLEEVARRTNNKLQYFHIRNDGRSGGTIGPMFSSATGIRAVDAGIPQLSMHSIRATTGSKDIELGVKLYSGFFSSWTNVDSDFRSGDI